MPKIVLCFFFAFLSPVVMADEIPVSSFGHMPLVEQPTVSPDGQNVAAVLNTGEVPSVVVGAFGAAEVTTILQLKFTDDRIEWIQWANNDRILISASFSAAIRPHRVRLSRLYVVNADGTGLKELRRRTQKDSSLRSFYADKDRVLSFLPEEPDHILLEIFDAADDAYSVFKVDIAKNKFTKQFVNSYDVNQWYADASGHVSLGIGVEKGVRTSWYRERGQQKFEKLHTRVIFEGETFTPIAVADGKVIVHSDRELGRNAIWQYDIQSGEFEKLLFAADDFDVHSAIMDSDRQRVIGATYYDHFERRHYFDEADAELHKIVRQSFPQYETNVVARSRDRKRIIVAAVSDNAPLKYFWLDMTAKKGGAWYSQFPELEGVSLTEVTPYEFEARDGMSISGYLTIPVREDGKLPPLVVYPHGGPHSRDNRYFDPLVQLFANRGYAVLQVNFRGSTGFGSAFEAAGYRQWGGKMQEDVYDAIDWLKTQETVDTERACVVGASYGGYVALTAAFQRPKQFACFVSVAGVTDLTSVVRSDSYWDTGRIAAYKVIGDLTDSEQKDELNRHSPLRRVREIARPLLLIHGDRDTRVPITQTKKFYKKARSADIDVKYVELPFGTHFLDDNKNRLATYTAIDQFLKRHLN